MEKEIYVKSPGKTIITITPETISIQRKGALNAMNHGFKGEKSIPIRNITAVQLKKPGMTNGYIQFTLSGGNESKGGVFNATQDENTIMFTKKNWEDMQELKSFIEKRQSEMHNQSTQTIVQETGKSPVEQVKELKELLDMGIITESEFEMKKNELLGL